MDIKRSLMTAAAVAVIVTPLAACGSSQPVYRTVYVRNGIISPYGIGSPMYVPYSSWSTHQGDFSTGRTLSTTTIRQYKVTTTAPKNSKVLTVDKSGKEVAATVNKSGKLSSFHTATKSDLKSASKAAKPASSSGTGSPKKSGSFSGGSKSSGSGSSTTKQKSYSPPKSSSFGGSTKRK